MIGVFSYLVIGYYTHRLSASKSALKAVVVNRISDGFLLWGILGLYWYHGTTDLDLVTFNGYTADFFSVAILIGAMGKSAQIGLHVWLADAMEGRLKSDNLKKKIFLLILFTCFFLYEVLPYFYIVFSSLTGVNNTALDDFIVAYGGVIVGRSKPLKNPAEITQQQKEIIAGLMMGDGCLRDPNSSKRNSGNFRLEFTFKEAVFDFCVWLKFDKLGSLSTTTLPTPHPKNNPTQYWFATRNHVYFTNLHMVWYIDAVGKAQTKYIKIMPTLEYLNMYFSAASLAYLIMGDGYWEKDSNTIYICTDCYTYEEVIFL